MTFEFSEIPSVDKKFDILGSLFIDFGEDDFFFNFMGLPHLKEPGYLFDYSIPSFIVFLKFSLGI